MCKNIQKLKKQQVDLLQKSFKALTAKIAYFNNQFV